MTAGFPDNLIELSGWLPAIIIPMATVIQLSEILRRRSAQGVSGLTWLLFGIANVGLYIYTEKYTSIQSVVGLLGSAVLDFVITALAFFNYGMALTAPDSTPPTSPN